MLSAVKDLSHLVLFPKLYGNGIFPVSHNFEKKFVQGADGSFYPTTLF
jgi:hypothetical protein